MARHTPVRSPTAPEDPDRIDLEAVGVAIRAFVGWCVRHWRRYAVVIAIFVLGSVLHSAFVQPVYTAIVKVLPYRGGQADLGGLSSLAGLAGISLPAGRQGPVVSTDAYAEITASFSFRSRLLGERIRFRDGEETLSAWLTRTNRSRWSERDEPESAPEPSTAVQADVPRSTGIAHRPAPARLSTGFVQQVKWVGARVHTSVDRKSGIVATEARMPDPVAAADLAQAASDLLTRDLMAYETRRADEQARFLLEQYAKADARYRSAQIAVARFQDSNRIMVTARTNAQLSLLQRDQTVAEEVLRSVTVQLESARVRQQEDTPLIAMLEPAVVPTRAIWPRPALSLAVMALLGTLVTTLWLYPGFRRERVRAVAPVE